MSHEINDNLSNSRMPYKFNSITNSFKGDYPHLKKVAKETLKNEDLRKQLKFDLYTFDSKIQLFLILIKLKEYIG